MKDIKRLVDALEILETFTSNEYEVLRTNDKENINVSLDPINIINSFKRFTSSIINKLEKLTNYDSRIGFYDKTKKCLFDISKCTDISDIYIPLDGAIFLALTDIETQDVSKSIIIRHLFKAYETINNDLSPNKAKKLTLEDFSKYIYENKLCQLIGLSDNEKAIFFQALCCLFIFKYHNEELRKASRLVNKILVFEGADKLGKSSFIRNFVKKIESLSDKLSISEYKYPKEKHLLDDAKNNDQATEDRINELMMKQQELFVIEIYNDLDEMFNNQFEYITFTVIDRWILSNKIYSNAYGCKDSCPARNVINYAFTSHYIEHLITKKCEKYKLNEYFDIITLVFYHDQDKEPVMKRDTDEIEKRLINEMSDINKSYKRIALDKRKKSTPKLEETKPYQSLLFDRKRVVPIRHIDNQVVDKSAVDQIIDTKVDNFINLFKQIDSVNDIKGEFMLNKIKKLFVDIKKMFDSSYKPNLKE